LNIHTNYCSLLKNLKTLDLAIYCWIPREADRQRQS